MMGKLGGHLMPVAKFSTCEGTELSFNVVKTFLSCLAANKPKKNQFSSDV